jgi:hypothetical protein
MRSTTMRPLLLAFALPLVSLVSAPASAATAIDMVEHLLGASNVNAVAGHGGLTAGISADGDLTVLAWPGPGYADHLAYVASNALDVRTKPHLGALDGMGSYLGLIVTTQGGAQLTWLRDAPWQASQGYSKPDAPVPVTTFTRADLGLTVTLTDVVAPNADVLTRHLRVALGPGSPVTGASLVLYENLSPTEARIPELPVTDWAFDSKNDYLAVYDPTSSAIVHFHPADKAVQKTLFDLVGVLPEGYDFGPADALMQSAAPDDASIDAFIAGLDAAYGPGVAALVTTEPAPTSFQVGSDATPLCAQMNAFADNIVALPAAFPGMKLVVDTSFGNSLRCTDSLDAVRAAHGWKWMPEDALADLADLTLSGSRLAAGQTNGALVAPLTFASQVAEGSAVFAFGPTLALARSALASATAQPFPARLAASEGAAHALLGAAALPDPALGARVQLVAQRALVNVYVARDREVGAVSASISRQAPYYPDWPRDGAFISAALDLAGIGAWVTQRDTWYTNLARTSATAGNTLLTPNVPTDPTSGKHYFPASAWEMNYYPEGVLAGSIRFEIDNTALHVWSVVAHSAHLSGNDRASFIAKVWPSSRDALDLLARWRDAATGLPAPANEDDDYDLTSTLHGAVTVYAALRSGARLAHAAGDDTRALSYQARAAELQGAILAAYYDRATGLFRDQQNGPSGAQGGDTGWLAWPGRVLAPDDPRLEAQLDADMAAVLEALGGQTEGGSYLAKNVLAAALLGKDCGSRDKARAAVTLLANVATQGTLHFGEVFVNEPGPGGTVGYSNRVDTPHVWEGALFYLSAMALTDPQRFDLEDQELPLPPAPSTAREVVATGGCRASRADDAGGLALLALPAAALAMRARRRARQPRSRMERRP